jgi:hypothetical protein
LKAQREADAAPDGRQARAIDGVVDFQETVIDERQHGGIKPGRNLHPLLTGRDSYTQA